MDLFKPDAPWNNAAAHTQGGRAQRIPPIHTPSPLLLWPAIVTTKEAISCSVFCL
jgi:hypothetical protein